MTSTQDSGDHTAAPQPEDNRAPWITPAISLATDDLRSVAVASGIYLDSMYGLDS